MPAILGILFLGLVVHIFFMLLEFIRNNYVALLALAGIIAIIFVAFYSMKSASEKAELSRIRAEQERAVKERLKQEADQKKEADRVLIYSLNNNAKATLYRCTVLLRQAEGYLSEAAELFRQRAFYLFWDKLELSAKAIQDYKKEVAALDYMARRYKETGEALNEPIPKFPGLASSTRLSAEPALTLERIDQLFHAAHRDFEFASIYSTRKTNTILTQGFANLSEAMRQISSGIGEVGRQLETGFRSLEASMDRMESSWSKGVRDIVGSVDSNNEKIAQMNRESLETERKMLDTLDNIQHGRVPLPTISSELKHATSTMPKKD